MEFSKDLQAAAAATIMAEAEVVSHGSEPLTAERVQIILQQSASQC
jgi:hypothetical protein